MRAAILGDDAVLAARPAEPIQLVRACLQAGFDFVAPVSWGEELLAARVADVVRTRRPGAVVVSSCPFVAESLRRRPPSSPCVASVAPPVATARYLRAALPGRAVHVTYVGACPGATAPDIDARLLPDVLLSRLTEAGISVVRQPPVLEGRLPPERARHASLPGGVPHPSWLAEHAGAIQVEVTPATMDAAVPIHATREVVLDLEAACGCTCARDRLAVARIEPPRSATPVVQSLAIDLADGSLLPVERLLEALPPGAPQPPLADAVLVVPAGEPFGDLRATFLERGLTHVDVFRPPEPLTSQRLSASLEPWADVHPGAARRHDAPAAFPPVSDAHRPRESRPGGAPPVPPYSGRAPSRR